MHLVRKFKFESTRRRTWCAHLASASGIWIWWGRAASGASKASHSKKKFQKPKRTTDQHGGDCSTVVLGACSPAQPARARLSGGGDGDRRSETAHLDRYLPTSSAGPSAYLHHGCPVDGHGQKKGVLASASASSLQSGCCTHMVDMSEAAEDTTRLLCQLAFRYPAGKQDQLPEPMHTVQELRRLQQELRRLQQLQGGGLYLTGHLRCRAAPCASSGSRGLSHLSPCTPHLEPVLCT
jgi:hypothetical protein